MIHQMVHIRSPVTVCFSISLSCLLLSNVKAKSDWSWASYKPRHGSRRDARRCMMPRGGAPHAACQLPAWTGHARASPPLSVISANRQDHDRCAALKILPSSVAPVLLSVSGGTRGRVRTLRSAAVTRLSRQRPPFYPSKARDRPDAHSVLTRNGADGLACGAGDSDRSAIVAGRPRRVPSAFGRASPAMTRSRIMARSSSGEYAQHLKHRAAGRRGRWCRQLMRLRNPLAPASPPQVLEPPRR